MKRRFKTMRNTKSNATLPSTTNTTIDTSKQTPIEIALQIDENGMTSLKNLYEFLELEQKNYSRWCKRNILENPFATENIDYIVVRQSEERFNPKPTCEYLLTSDFAKQLSMTVKNERGQEARKYFIACEQGLKVATQKLQPNNNINEMMESLNAMTQAITTLTNNMITMQQDIQELKQSQRNRYLLEKRYPSAWYKKIAPKYKMLMDYFDCTRSELYSSIYKELEDMYNIDINQIHEDYCYENHLLKDECYPMDAIEHNTQLRDALTLLIDSNLVKYGLQTEDEIKNFKRKTLFDTEVKIKEV